MGFNQRRADEDLGFGFYAAVIDFGIFLFDWYS